MDWKRQLAIFRALGMVIQENAARRRDKRRAIATSRYVTVCRQYLGTLLTDVQDVEIEQVMEMKLKDLFKLLE